MIGFDFPADKENTKKEYLVTCTALHVSDSHYNSHYVHGPT